MKLSKKKLTTILLGGFTVVILISIFLTTKIMLSSNGKNERPLSIASVKIKASNVTYKKLIAINKNSQGTDLSSGGNEGRTLELTSTPIPTEVPSVTENLTPTEIILAINNSPTPGSLTITLVPTKTESLPKTGSVWQLAGIVTTSIAFILLSFSL